MPAASSGIEYATLDERCEACQVLGGDEEPCIPKSQLRKIEQTLGRPCPRVELAPANVDAAGMIPYLVNEELRPMALDHWRETFEGLDSEGRRAIRQRIAYALQHSDVLRSRRDAVKRQSKRERP